MKNKLINKVHLEGRLYQHKLEMRETGPNSKNPGTKYITGSVDVATNDDLTNIVTVHYTYVTANYSSNKPNPNFTVLSDIAEGKYPTVMDNGAEVAVKVSIDTAIGLNDFYTDRQSTDNGEPTLVSAKRNEGGFIRIITALNSEEKNRNRFEVDMVITGFTRREADEEKGYPEKGILKGAIFDFRNALLPVEFGVTNAQAMNYFEGLEPSSKNPIFTRIKGTEISEVIKRTITSEGAFGDEVREVESTRKDFIITWAQADPYEWDTEETMTVAELTKAMTDRQTYLAEVKQRYQDYKSSQGTNAPSSAFTAATSNSTKTFDF